MSNPVQSIDPVRFPLTYSVSAAVQVADEAPESWKAERCHAWSVLARTTVAVDGIAVASGGLLRFADLRAAHAIAADACHLALTTGVTP